MRVPWKVILPPTIVSILVAVFAVLGQRDIWVSLGALLLSFTVTLGVTVLYLYRTSSPKNTAQPPIHEIHTEPQKAITATRSDEKINTAEIPVTPIPQELDETVKRWRKPRPRRSIEPVAEGIDQYRVRSNNWTPERPPWRQFWQRSKWHPQPTDLRFTASPLIQQRLVRRVRFEILSSESRLVYLKRAHWWAHGLQQIGITVVWLCVAMILLAMTAAATTDSASITLVALVGWTAAGVALSLRVWFRWIFTYYIVTDKRIILLYDPPILDGFVRQLALDEISLPDVDQSMIGKVLNFATLIIDTPKDKDEWAHDLRLIYAGSELARIITELKGI